MTGKPEIPEASTAPVDSEPQPQPQPGPSRAEKLKQQIADNRDPAQAKAREPASQEPTEPKPSTPESLTLDWGEGVERTMTVKDLVAAAKRAEEGDQAFASAKKLIGEDFPLVQEIANGFRNLNPEQKAQVSALLEGKTQPAADPNHDPTDGIDPATFMDHLKAPDGQQPTTLDPATAQDIAELKAWKAEKQRTEQLGQLADTISNKIAGYTELAKDEGARKLCAKAVFNEMLINPNQSMDNLIKAYAGDHLTMLRGVRERTVGEAGEPRPDPVAPGEQEFATLKPERALTGDDLNKGGIRRAAEAALAGEERRRSLYGKLNRPS